MADCLSNLGNTVVFFVYEKDLVNFWLLGLSGDCEKRILSDVFRLIGNSRQAVEDDQQSKQVP